MARKTSRLDSASALDAISRLMIQALQSMDAYVPEVMADTDREALHQYRVNLRKTRSLVKEFSRPLNQPGWRLHQAFFKRAGEITAEVRDLDVYLMKAEGWGQQLDETEQSALLPFTSLLIARRAEAYKHLMDYLNSGAYEQERAAWDQALTAPSQEGTGDVKLRALVATRIRVRFAALIKAGRGLHFSSPDSDFHKLRLDFKRFRYLMEDFVSVFGNKHYGGLLDAVKGMQTLLGDFQDISVQKARLHEFSDELALDKSVRHDTFFLLGSLAERMSGDHDGLKRRFLKKFARLEKAGKEQVTKALVRG